MAPSSRLVRPLALLLALVAAVALAACGSDDDASGGATGAGAAGAFPAKVAGAFGTATVESAPKRVVALGWNDQDVLVGLGVAPVAVFDLAAFPAGVGPWGLRQLGDRRPTKLAVADGIPFEKIASLRPDLIVAVQSGVTKADYAKLEKIAPTVTYAAGRTPYGTPWAEQARIIGRAVGREPQARRLVERAQAKLAAAKREYADLRGTTFTHMALGGDGQLAVYAPSDPRVKLLTDLGMRVSAGEIAATKGTDGGFGTVSLERLASLDADVLIAWFNGAGERRALTGRPGFRRLRVARRAGFVPLDAVAAQAIGAPSVLSIPWSVDRVLPLIDAAAKGRGARS
ncbi:iron-siderophore ABC transporter substrate-binding protein [Patulibacter sp. S7RM1-6]